MLKLLVDKYQLQITYNVTIASACAGCTAVGCSLMIGLRGKQEVNYTLKFSGHTHF